MGIKLAQKVLLQGCLAALLALAAGCATPPGSDLHEQVGKDASQGTIAMAVWLPEHVKGPLWLQFEKRNAQGQPTGIPVSVLVGSPQKYQPQSLPTRPGWRGYSLALPVAPGGYVFSRWLGEVDGKTPAATSAYVGWPFDVAQGKMAFLGHISLDIDPVKPADTALAYRIRSVDGTAQDVALVRRNIEATRTQPWQAVSLSGGAVAMGTAALGGTANILIQNTLNYSQYK